VAGGWRQCLRLINVCEMNEYEQVTSHDVLWASSIDTLRRHNATRCIVLHTIDPITPPPAAVNDDDGRLNNPSVSACIR